jgi:hypothetical protein
MAGIDEGAEAVASARSMGQQGVQESHRPAGGIERAALDTLRIRKKDGLPIEEGYWGADGLVS